MKISRILVIVLVASSILPIIGLSITVNSNINESTRDSIENHLVSVATIQKTRIIEITGDYEERISNIQVINLAERLHQYNLNSTEILKNEIIGDLIQIRDSIHNYHEIKILDLNGDLYISTETSIEEFDFADHLLFQKGKTEIAIGDFFHENNMLLIRNYAPLMYNGSIIAVIAVEEDTQEIRDITDDYSGLGDTGETILAMRTIQGDAVFITNTRFYQNASLQVTIPSGDVNIPITQSLLNIETIMKDAIDYRGEPVIAVTKYIESLDWGIVVKQDKAEIFAVIEDEQREIILISSMTVIVMVIIAIYLARYISRPITQLTEMSDEAAKGNLKIRTEVKFIDEIIILANSFNTLASNLSKETDARLIAEAITQENTIALQDRAESLDKSNKELEILQNKLTQYNLELETRVEERTRKLTDSINELNSFAYTVTHDLRAPLRAMQGFADILIEDYAEKIDEVGQSYLTRISNASIKMDKMIQDLLIHSRFTREEFDMELLNPKTLILKTLKGLDDIIQSENVNIQIKGEFPEIMLNELIFRHIIQNLIINAVKFRYQGRDPKIRIWSEIDSTVLRIYIEDNGIGIEEQYFEKIFKVFERLHGEEQYPGTGIGLAIVKRGIETLGGKIIVESELGIYTRFCIELNL